VKLVREYINEKFTEGGDPIRDMGIGASDSRFQKIMKDAKRFESIDKNVAYKELVKYGFFKTKKEAADLMYHVLKYIQKDYYNDITDMRLTWFLSKEEDIKKAEKIIHFIYLLDDNCLYKIVQILIWQNKKELFDICFKKYGKKFLKAIKETGTYISGVGWREMPEWYNQILAKELQKTNFFDLKRKAIQKKVVEMQKELDKITQIENKKVFTEKEAIDMASYFEQYKQHLSDKKYGFSKKL
jgi:hypothetical protein